MNKVIISLIFILTLVMFMVFLFFINKRSELNNEIAKHMKEKFNAYIFSEGRFVDKNHKIEDLTFGFNCYDKVLTIPEARIYIINFMNEIIKIVNSYKELSDEYSKFPIEYNNIALGLILYKNYQHEVSTDPYLDSVRSQNNKIYYVYRDNPYSEKDKFKERVVEETLQEALQKIKDEQVTK